MTTRPPIPYTEMSIVRTLKHHLRGFLVAVAALSISASAVFAATAHSGNGPADAASDGLKRATETTETTTPSRPDQTVKDADDEDKDLETIESVTTGDKATRATKATKAVKAADRPVNHGWYVSRAAKAATPAGFDSHGAYVSTIAKGDLGKPASATDATDATEQSAKGQAKAAIAKAKAAQRKAARQP